MCQKYNEAFAEMEAKYKAIIADRDTKLDRVEIAFRDAFSRLQKMQKENEKLQAELDKANKIIDVVLKKFT